jgi:hypothetical protein
VLKGMLPFSTLDSSVIKAVAISKDSFIRFIGLKMDNILICGGCVSATFAPIFSRLFPQETPSVGENSLLLSHNLRHKNVNFGVFTSKLGLNIQILSNNNVV